MKHKKIASILAIAVLSLATPFFSMPRAHAFDDNTAVGITGTQRYSDPFFGFSTVTSARDGSVVTFNVLLQASSVATPNTGQRNVTVGVKFDWMTSWTNASNANPSSTLAVMPNQDVTVSVSVTLPSLTGTTAGYNLVLHSWQVLIASGALNSVNACPSHTGLQGCVFESGGSFAIYSGDQLDGMDARRAAEEKFQYLSTISGFAIGPGFAKLAADLSQAQAERDLGNTAYAAGNFGQARTHYQNALNLANSAASALSGGDAATYTNVLLGGIGIFLLGVGVFIAGFGGFWYALRRPKMKMA